MIGKFDVLLVTDAKHCNKLRITEDCLSTRTLLKTFAEMCEVNFSDGYINYLFEESSRAVYEFSDETGKLLEIRRQAFTTRF